MPMVMSRRPRRVSAFDAVTAQIAAEHPQWSMRAVYVEFMRATFGAGAYAEAYAEARARERRVHPLPDLPDPWWVR